MRSVMKKDREMRDLDREIGFAPEPNPNRKLNLLSFVAEVVGYITLGTVLFLLTIATIHVLFYLF